MVGSGMWYEPKESEMIDIKLRNVHIDDAASALHRVKHFMDNYSERRGVRNGVSYASLSGSGYGDRFYVYRTAKMIVCVGYYAPTSE